MTLRLLALAAVATLAAPASATILTFDIDNGRPNDILAMDQAYGDRVVATTQGNASYGVGAEGFTPNVLASYQPTTASLTRWTTGFGDLVNVLENEDDGDTLLAVTLTADTGFRVALYGFDLGGYPDADYIVPGLTILDGSTVLFSQANVLVRGATGTPRHSTFSFATPLTGSNLSIRIDLTGLGGSSDNIGIDNIRFGQGLPVTPGVPEPASWVLLIAGFGLAGGALRRRGGMRPAHV